MSSPIRAVVFDAYGTLFDVHSVAAAAERLFPGRGAELSQLWRDRQLMYSWLRTLSDRYRPFSDVTRDALRFAARRLSLAVDPSAESALMDEYARLAAFPENLQALRTLRAAELPLAILSNGDPRMLAASVRSAGMDELFAHLLSVDSVRRYKTSADAYGLGPQAFALPAAELLFVSSNGWDVAGAGWYGYRTFWINRLDAPAEELDVAPQASGRLLTDVVDYINKVNTARSL
ncbi:MAG TPA: haloacid dehalogenase type II [Burkholderiaceae bacterium]|nr:haloacid dehalogenase type II [Burkholderiaceae bacterium]